MANINFGGTGGFNNFQSTVIGSQVLGTQNNFGSVNAFPNAVKEELSILVNTYIGKLPNLTQQEQQQLMWLAQLQEQVKKDNPEKSAVSKLLPFVSGISGAVNIVKTLYDWVSGLS